MRASQQVRAGLDPPLLFRASLCRWPPPGGLLRCGRRPRWGMSSRMPMSPARFAECLDTIGWTKRGLARRLGVGQAAVRQMANGRHEIRDDVGAWLEYLAAAHVPLSPELRELCDRMGCDRGEWVRYPRGIRPLSDEEAATLRHVAEAHTAAPLPPGWVPQRDDQTG
jgi:transcriptional regulator with XRE-family HTH domain